MQNIKEVLGKDAIERPRQIGMYGFVPSKGRLKHSILLFYSWVLSSEVSDTLQGTSKGQPQHCASPLPGH